MSAFDNPPYCSDEDCYHEVEADWDAVYPRTRGSSLATESDGMVAAASWDLASASQNFSGLGVTIGSIATLTHPSFGPTPMALVVQSVLANTLTLRAPYLGPGVGDTPGLLQSVSGIEFAVITLAWQREKESAWAARQLNYDDDGTLVGAEDLRRLVAKRVACELYWNASRNPGDLYWEKAKLCSQWAEMYLKDIAARRRSIYAAEAYYCVPSVNDHWSPEP